MDHWNFEDSLIYITSSIPAMDGTTWFAIEEDEEDI